MKKEQKNEISLPFREDRRTGKIENESLIAYVISMPIPIGENFETDPFFSDLADAFLHFLEKKSREKREGVYFGGIRFQAEGQRVFLSASFSPFEERVFFPVATLYFSEKGAIQRIETKRKRER